MQRRTLIYALTGSIVAAGCLQLEEAENDEGTVDDGPADGDADEGDGEPSGSDGSEKEEEENVPDSGEDSEDHDEGDPNGADPGDVSYGVLVPEVLSQYSNAAVLPAEQLSEADLDLEVDVLVGDTDLDPTRAVEEAEAMIDDGVRGIVGPLSVDAVMEVATETLVPTQTVGVAPHATAPEISDLDDGYIFRTSPSDELQGAALAEVADEVVGANTIGSLSFSQYGDPIARELLGQFEDRGGEVLTEAVVEPGASDYEHVLAEVADTDPDVLFLGVFGEPGIELLQRYYELYGADRPILVPHAIAGGPFLELVDGDVSTVIGTRLASTGPSADHVAELYEEIHDETPPEGPALGHTYDAAALITLASAAADGEDGAALRDAIPDVASPGGEIVTAGTLPEGFALAASDEPIEYRGASAPLEFDEHGDPVRGSYDVVVYENDRLEIVETIEIE